MSSAVLVTGAGAGIGRAIAIRLACGGDQVGVLDRDAAAARATVELVSAAGGRALRLVADVADEAEVTSAVEEFVSWAGGLDGLVNNAGGFTRTDPLDAVRLEEWEHVVAVNLRGPFLCTREAAPHLRRSGAGRVVNVASVAGRTAIEGTSLPYAAAKAGLIGLTRRLAIELAPDGVAVNVVAPGLVRTERLEQVHGDRLRALAATVPAGRLAEPEEIAATVAFLLRPEAGYLVGATVDVNGGRIPV